MAQIVIDPGHGGMDPGGGSNIHFKEKDMVLKISLEQKRHFERNGISVYMTRTTDEFLPANKRTPRVRGAGAKYCISNHINAGGGEGAETIYSIFSKSTIANGIMNALVKAGARKRRVFTRRHGNNDYYYMHRETGSVNTVIVEYGFADNARDTQKILNDWREYAEAVARYYIENVFQKNYIGDDGKVSVSQAVADRPASTTGAWDVRYGETGARVGQVQRILRDLGYYKGELDNSFGPAMRTAVQAFQLAQGLTVDGIFGPGSQAAAKKAKKKDPMYRVIKDGKQIGAYRENDNALREIRKAIEDGAKNIKIERV